eukprot:SAG11_NODE_5092_length_1666_cov_2.855775_2_plen_78_part_00
MVGQSIAGVGQDITAAVPVVGQAIAAGVEVGQDLTAAVVGAAVCPVGVARKENASIGRSRFWDQCLRVSCRLKSSGL